MHTRFCLEIRGDFACFTRPEMKVERVSYDIITPSAVRAVFESILWKPAICWQPERIEVLAPIRWTTIRRNEVGSKLSAANVKSAMQRGTDVVALYVEEDRQQRASLLLRDVRYRIAASFSLTGRAGAEENTQKFAEMFVRRAERGQCINQPYLGCREFSCDFRLVESGEATATIPEELHGERDLGWMLYDLDFSDATSPQPRFFHAHMKDGIVKIPSWDSADVRG
ncbi:MAG TPA: type I-C CRISPR-associated protein Cas5c [Acidobacteriaceae bacterium]|jgi:CRISPR-associated protein Cas5d|nr:type I-C CRISPR-associated protein Cas5c [Acidobacteriaceae bacterium]